MGYKALYRTYRPSTFDEVAGQQHIVKTLKNALESGKIAHAYLFCGPRGTGKTSMAKLFAKALNCEEGIGHQCNECSNCRAVLDGSHPDVVEIDAASNNGVDQVRDLIDKVRYSPIKGRYKVYIIDEVHMMTPGAFNALLKTLEEPPAHVIFIMATTEPHKILPTIISRCQRFDFAKVSDEDLRKRLVDILAKEQVEYEPEALEWIISLADGGVRDALSILDQALAYSSRPLKEKDIEDIFGLASKEEKIQFLELIAQHQAKEALEKTSQFLEGGVELRRLTSDLLDILKDLLIYETTLDSSLCVVLKEEEAKHLGEMISNARCLEMIQILLEALQQYKNVSNIRSLFQIVLLHLLQVSAKKEQTVKIEEPKVVEKPVKENPKEERKVEEVPPKEPAKPVIERKTLALEGEKNQLDDDLLIRVMTSGKKQMKASLKEKWQSLSTYQMDEEYGAVASFLQESIPYAMNEKLLILVFKFSRNAERANIIKNQSILRAFVRKVSGFDVPVYAISDEKRKEIYEVFSQLMNAHQLPIVQLENLEIHVKGE